MNNSNNWTKTKYQLTFWPSPPASSKPCSIKPSTACPCISTFLRVQCDALLQSLYHVPQLTLLQFHRTTWHYLLLLLAWSCGLEEYVLACLWFVTICRGSSGWRLGFGLESWWSVLLFLLCLRFWVIFVVRWQCDGSLVVRRRFNLNYSFLYIFNIDLVIRPLRFFSLDRRRYISLLNQTQFLALISILIASLAPQLVNHRPRQPDNFEKILPLKWRVLRVYLHDLIGSLPGLHHSPHVYKHGQTHCIDELILFLTFWDRWLQSLKKHGVPDVKRVEETELSCVHAPDPS